MFIFYLDQLPTVVFSNARFVMLMFICIVKRAGMRPTRASVKIVSFSLDFVVIQFYRSLYFQFLRNFKLILKNLRS